MDRFEVALKGQIFVVFDKITGEEVFSGGKTAVEEWLDFKENQLRWEERKKKKRRLFGFLFSAA